MPRQPRPPATEQLHQRSKDLELAGVAAVVRRLHAEDKRALRAVGKVLPQVVRAASAAARALGQGGRLIYVGAGTSGRIGALDAAEIPPTFGTHPSQVQAVIAGGPQALTRAVEGAEDDRRAGAQALRRLRVSEHDFVVGITASGTTPFVRAALQVARQAGALTALVSSNTSLIASDAADLLILPATGPELIAGSTRLKAGTATKVILNAISTAAMVELGKVYRGRMIDLRATNAKLTGRAERMVAELTELPLPQARALLKRAQGKPRLALAMHFTGLPRAQAEKTMRARRLRELEPAP